MTHDPVNHPRHYQNASGVECIDVAEHLSFNLGNAFKYVYRRNGKGSPIQDLEKARWYLSRERDLWTRLGVAPEARAIYPPLPDLARSIAASEPGHAGDAMLLIALAEWSIDPGASVAKADLLLGLEIDRLGEMGAP